MWSSATSHLPDTWCPMLPLSIPHEHIGRQQPLLTLCCRHCDQHLNRSTYHTPPPDPALGKVIICTTWLVCLILPQNYLSKADH